MANDNDGDKEKKEEQKPPQKIEETNEKPKFPPLEDVRNYTILPGRRKDVDHVG